MKRPCIVVAGPTAVGKSGIAVRLAKLLGGAVVSADSMQVYKKMNIGSAKISEDEMCGVKHYLIDVLDPKEEFHVVKFQEMAKEAMEDIYSRNMIPIITGGTGFYIQALIKDVDFTQTGRLESVRCEYAKIAEEKGAEYLHALLKQKDHRAAAEIHPNNIKRVIRALEFYDETGGAISAHNEIQIKKQSPYDCSFFVLTDDRQALYDRINKRVDIMMQDGLLEEVTALYRDGLVEDDVSMKGIGYREFFPYFRGEITLEECVEKIKSDTRHFAKRQLTWFKREKDAVWIDRRDYGGDDALIAEAMAENWRHTRNA